MGAAQHPAKSRSSRYRRIGMWIDFVFPEPEPVCRLCLSETAGGPGHSLYPSAVTLPLRRG